LQDERKSYYHEGIFGSRSKEEVDDIESIVEEKKKAEVGGSRTEVVGDKAEVEGRTGVEEERMRREVEAGRRRKEMYNDRGNNIDTG